MAQTADDILAVLEKWAAEKQVIDAHAFLDAAVKLNLLLGDESDKLFAMEQKVSLMRIELLEGGANATIAKMRVEGSDEYREARSQKAKIERIIEAIRLAKHRARLADEEYRSNR